MFSIWFRTSASLVDALAALVALAAGLSPQQEPSFHAATTYKFCLALKQEMQTILAPLSELRSAEESTHPTFGGMVGSSFSQHLAGSLPIHLLSTAKAT
jgi:hypothetical protein